MITLTHFAHAEHYKNMNMDTATALDHCAPIIFGAAIIITILIGIIVYLLVAWHPKTHKKAPSVKKKSSKK